MAEQVYRFTTWQDAKGRNYARCGELEASSMSSAIAALARVIVALDCVPDGPIEAYGRNGRRSLTIGSLYWYATMTISNADDRLVKWTPSPFARAAA